MMALGMGSPAPSNQSTEDTMASNESGDQQIRIALYPFWIGLPPERRNHETLQAEFQKIIDNALYALRGDAFGLAD